MKKLSYLLGLFIAAGLLFSACDKDEETLDPPSLSFLGGTNSLGYERVDGDVTATVGDSLFFGFTASKVSSEDIRRIFIERNYENVSTYTVDEIDTSAASVTMEYLVFAYPQPGIEDFTITVWDKADLSSTISFTVTTEPAAPNITTYEDRILGAQQSNTGSSFASIDGTVYMLEEAKNNSSEIDFMYYYGTNNHATIAAPDDTDAASVFVNLQYGLATWDVKNATRFKETTLSSADFNAITSSQQLVIAATIPTGPDQSSIKNLSVGKVLAFKTADELYGLIRIDNITGVQDGSVDITVKVQ